MASKFINELRIWFEEEKRIFPWRKNISPYAVWISEVMLQQTRASVVISYFLRWMERFPSVKALAEAQIDEVIKMWEGLGYYSRARALHEGAQYFVNHFGGKIPSDPEQLAKVKGLGPYTIGAIRSFAFHQRAAAVDGNVLRVIARLYGIEEEIDQPFTKKKVTQIVEELLPDREPWVIMEALIELGASVCGKKPDCEKCPMKEGCLSFERGKTDLIPKKKKPPEVTVLKREVYVIAFGTKVLVQKKEGKSVMSGLYEFPYVEKGSDAPFQNLTLYKKLKEVKHTFTRYRAHLFPTIWEIENKIEEELFVELEELKNLAFSSGHKKVLNQVLEAYAHTTYRKF